MVFNKGIRTAVTEKVTFEESGDGSEEVSCKDIWRRSIPGRGPNQCKDTKVGACLVHLRPRRPGWRSRVIQKESSAR